MTNPWIFYKIYARKLYSRKNKGWQDFARSLARIILLMHIISFFFIFELALNLNVIGSFIIRHDIPWGPFVGTIVGLILIVKYFLIGKNKTHLPVQKVKMLILRANNVSNWAVVLLVIISIIAFILVVIMEIQKILN